MVNRKLLAVALLAFTAILPRAYAEGIDAAVQTKIDAKVKEVQTWAADATIVSAVKAQNASTPADISGMTQDKWKSLSKLDPAVRVFAKNPAGVFLKSKQDDTVAEAFLSDAKGFKVAFLAKTTSFCHAGKPKHDQPMAGKTWQGPVEVDESSGVQGVQVAVPVLDGDKPIGSLVVGLNLAKLK